VRWKHFGLHIQIPIDQKISVSQPPSRNFTPLKSTKDKDRKKNENH
jgi:hypothetical protein